MATRKDRKFDEDFKQGAVQLTEQLYLATFPSGLPDVRNGIRINKPKVF